MLAHLRARFVRALPFVLLTLVVIGAAAPAAGAAPVWLSPASVSAAGRDASVPQVALGATGDAVAVWSRFDGAHAIIQAAVRPAGGPWGAPTDLSAAGQDALDPQVALDGAGNAIAAWTRSDGVNQIAQAAVRPVGGAWQQATSLSATGQDAALPQVAVNRAGDAVVVWTRAGFGSESRVQAAVRPAGGAWQPTATLSAAGQDAYDAEVGIDPQGNAVAVWDRSNGTNQIVQAASRPAGGAWQTPSSLSAPGQNGIYPQVAVDGQGRAVAVWYRLNGVNAIVQAAVKPLGGIWPSVASNVSAAGGDADMPQVAVDLSGNAVAVWRRYDGTNLIVQAASRPVGGAWQVPVSLSVAGRDAEAPQVVVDAQGDAVAVWDRFDGSRTVAQAAMRPAGGAWSATPDTLSAAGQDATNADVALDGQGNGAAVWLRSDGADIRVQAAGYDGGGPDLQPLTVPSTGTVGEALSFSVSPLDAWSALGSTSWAFGDGGSASGLGVTHAYAAPGTYPVAVTGTDALGNSSTASASVTITGTVPPGPTPDPDPDPPAATTLVPTAPTTTTTPMSTTPTPPPPSVAPVLSRVSQARATWRLGSQLAQVAAKKPRPAVGTVFAFNLNQAASVTATFTQRQPGRKAGRTCVALTGKNRSSRACTRTVTIGALALTGHAGKNTVTFFGRLSRTKTLKPGRYTVTLGAKNAANQSAAPTSLTFTIARG